MIFVTTGVEQVMVDTSIQTGITPAARSARIGELFQRVWPPAVMLIGVALTLAWAAFLGYELISIVSLAF